MFLLLISALLLNTVQGQNECTAGGTAETIAANVLSPVTPHLLSGTTTADFIAKCLAGGTKSTGQLCGDATLKIQDTNCAALSVSIGATATTDVPVQLNCQTTNIWEVKTVVCVADATYDEDCKLATLSAAEKACRTNAGGMFECDTKDGKCRLAEGAACATTTGANKCANKQYCHKDDLICKVTPNYLWLIIIGVITVILIIATVTVLCLWQANVIKC